MRLLLVHHTASSNRYAREDVPGLIRGSYATHIGPDRSWPDVAYNFFVDRYGVVWEGRSGSLAGPVKPDATGGSQGFAQLCGFIGDHQTEAPSDAARLSMITLLTAIADTYGIDTTPGATTTFVSRGSNRWPLDSSVTATTIAGHRDMSQSICPGDAAYELVLYVFPAEVSAIRASRTVRRLLVRSRRARLRRDLQRRVPHRRGINAQLAAEYGTNFFHVQAYLVNLRRGGQWLPLDSRPPRPTGNAWPRSASLYRCVPRRPMCT
ncbi:MAG: N-acetylmuramoyl-L-alanine amidase [Geodermatophilaceae bacterium]|nr:N-acetylmuramoyl-L-alanine amidase [Geodermatophilaceae bacterium]